MDTFELVGPCMGVVALLAATCSCDAILGIGDPAGQSTGLTNQPSEWPGNAVANQPTTAPTSSKALTNQPATAPTSDVALTNQPATGAGGGDTAEPGEEDESGKVLLGFDEGEVHYEYVCAATFREACERSCDECLDALDIDNASFGIPTCSSVCDCSNRSTRCAEWADRFFFGAMDADIEAACTRAQALRHSIPFCISALECLRYSIAERPEAASYYECLADGAEVGACQNPECLALVGASTFGPQLCGAAARCGECPLDEQSLNDNAWFWRDDVRAAALRCTELPSCERVQGCLLAWYSGVTGVELP